MNYDMKSVRKELHQIPELAFVEQKTQQLILDKLSGFNHLQVLTFEHTGILVVYKGGSGPYKLFRADMDALPVTEETGVDFTSQHPGRMHACGHDIHMAVLLGLIQKVCTELPAQNYLFLFQPAEEGYGGAKLMIEHGIFAPYSIAACYALHVSPDYEVGQIASRAGVTFGLPVEFNIDFIGESAHAAHPQKGADALAAAAAFYTTMQALVIKRLPAMEPVIFHAGKFVGGTARNILAERIRIEGTLRLLHREYRQPLLDLLEHCAAQIGSVYGCTTKVEYPCMYDPVVNNAGLYAHLQQILPNSVELVECETQMVGEDFGFFTSLYPGLIYWLGCGKSNKGLHNPGFMPQDDCLEVGLQVMWALAVAPLP